MRSQGVLITFQTWPLFQTFCLCMQSRMTIKKYVISQNLQHLHIFYHFITIASKHSSALEMIIALPAFLCLQKLCHQLAQHPFSCQIWTMGLPMLSEADKPAVYQPRNYTNIYPFGHCLGLLILKFNLVKFLHAHLNCCQKYSLCTCRYIVWLCYIKHKSKTGVSLSENGSFISMHNCFHPKNPFQFSLKHQPDTN